MRSLCNCQNAAHSTPADTFPNAADANILINTCRLAAQRYLFAYQEPIPVEQLVRTLCDNKQVSPSCQHLSFLVSLLCLQPGAFEVIKILSIACHMTHASFCMSVNADAILYLQGYTQYGGLRPFGVSLLYAGW